MLSAQKAWPRLTFIINHRRSRSLPASATRLFSKKLEYLKEDGIGRCLSLHCNHGQMYISNIPVGLSLQTGKYRQSVLIIMNRL